jgi:hypothetical protein
MYGLAKTGFATVTVGGIAVARPLLAAGIAVVLVSAGIVLRITGRRKDLVK